MFAVDDEHLSHIQDNGDGKVSWEKLQILHEKSGMSSLLRDLREGFTLELGDENMQTFIANLKGRFRLKVMDVDLPEAVQVAILLNSLPDRYQPTVLAWEASEIVLTMDDVVGKLLNVSNKSSRLHKDSVSPRQTSGVTNAESKAE
jgi:hypothetical protein